MIVLYKDGIAKLVNEFSYTHLLKQGYTLDPNDEPQFEKEESLEDVMEEVKKETDEALEALQKAKKKVTAPKKK